LHYRLHQTTYGNRLLCLPRPGSRNWQSRSGTSSGSARQAWMGRSCRWTRRAGRSSAGCWRAEATYTTPRSICSAQWQGPARATAHPPEAARRGAHPQDHAAAVPAPLGRAARAARRHC
jgi:hypothetical protein